MQKTKIKNKNNQNKMIKRVYNSNKMVLQRKIKKTIKKVYFQMMRIIIIKKIIIIWSMIQKKYQMIVMKVMAMIKKIFKTVILNHNDILKILYKYIK